MARLHGITVLLSVILGPAGMMVAFDGPRQWHVFEGCILYPDVDWNVRDAGVTPLTLRADDLRWVTLLNGGRRPEPPVRYVEDYEDRYQITRIYRVTADPSARSFGFARATVGWPLRCREFLGTPGQLQRGDYQDSRILPLGMALNSGLGSVAAFIMCWLGIACFLGMRAVIHTMRVPPGHCLACRYDLRGAPACGCPECGWNRVDRWT